MTQEEIEKIIHDYIKENLRITIDDYSSYYTTVDIYLKDELVSSDSCMFKNE